ncbi:hypothetical protein [Barrientosiimonas humi]|uniref:hypothetical protein n=1 Tax=Barrientosiimonas humi TaxID=999931 RepID=UPI00370DBDD5
MGFEVFKKSSAPVPSVPSVTIQKRGLMSLNRAAYSMLESPEAIELLWDSDRRIIGMRAAKLESPDAYPARPQSSSSERGPILIAGSLFTRYIGLDTSNAKRWVPSLEGDILTIDLSVDGQPVSSNRRGTGATEDDSS